MEAQDTQDVRILHAAEAREREIGVEAARADNLSDELVGRLLDGEHPIAVWREHRGLTVSALAERADVSRSYLTEIEAGKKPGSVAAYRSLAEASRVTLDYIVPDNAGAA